MTKTDHLEPSPPIRLNYTDLHRGIYSYFGYNNPLSIWNF